MTNRRGKSLMFDGLEVGDYAACYYTFLGGAVFAKWTIIVFGLGDPFRGFSLGAFWTTVDSSSEK
jgi:hypothetical protein